MGWEVPNTPRSAAGVTGGTESAKKGPCALRREFEQFDWHKKWVGEVPNTPRSATRVTGGTESAKVRANLSSLIESNCSNLRRSAHGPFLALSVPPDTRVALLGAFGTSPTHFLCQRFFISAENTHFNSETLCSLHKMSPHARINILNTLYKTS